MWLSGKGWREMPAGGLLALLLLLGMSALPGRTQAAAYEPDPEFCQPHTVRDYAAPFKRMPKLRQPSESGRVGFGPESLRLRPTPSLVFGAGEVGFTLAVVQRKGLSLPWTATTTAVEVNGNGRPIGKSRRSVKRVGWLKRFYGDSFSFEVPDGPAFYRATIVLHGASGQRLGKFSSYYRVMALTEGARLRLNASAYRRETVVFARVENFGTIPVSYGMGYDIERLEGETWVEAPESPRGPVIAIGLSSPPGMSGGRCLAFGIPGSMLPGRYRMVKEVNIASWTTRERIEQTLTAEFDIVP